jgi:iron complex transport system substrate-binding protein
MSFRSLAARAAVLLALLLAAVTGRAAEFVDSAGRRVMLPDEITRIMPAGPASAVFVYVLVPAKLIGWPAPLSRAQRGLMPAKYARLPVVGQLGGPFPTATADDVIRLHPDLIVGYGRITRPTVALADRIQQQTHTPYILLDGSIQQMPQMLRGLTPILGAGDHGLAVSSYAFHAIGALRGQLLITSPTNRPLVYYGRGPDGLETALPGSAEASMIEQGGVINVAGALGRDGLTRVTPQQIIDWNPQIIIAQERSFYNALLHSPQWRGLLAVSAKRVYLQPADPFGWIDDPPGVNRAVGMYWLSSLFYPDLYQQDLGGVAREFYQLYYGVQLSDRQLQALIGPALGNAGQPQRLANVPLLGAEPSPMPNLPPARTATPPMGGRGRQRSGPPPQ